MATSTREHRSGVRSHRRPFNLAIIGRSNSGKSSFIKAMFHSQFGQECNINPPIDLVECTMECKRYHHGDSPVVLWDVPGCGTVRVPSADYPSKINMDRYDGFIICVSNVFSEYELALHNLVAIRKKTHVIVRTNVASAIANEQHAHPQSFNREITLQTIRKKIEDHLYKTGAPIFLVDNHHPEEFDFPDLQFMIFNGDLSNHMKSAGQRHKH